MSETTPQIPQRLRKGIPNTYRTDYCLKDIWKHYKKRLGKNRPKEVTVSLFSKIVKEFQQHMMGCILAGEIFYMPHGLGDISVQKFKHKVRLKDGKLVGIRHTDYKRTMEFWKKNPEAYAQRKILFHTNEHTDNYNYKFYWRKQTAVAPGVSSYSFKATRLASRRLAAILKETGNANSYQLTPNIQ